MISECELVVRVRSQSVVGSLLEGDAQGPLVLPDVAGFI
jgi:hypothetical protein